MELDFTQSHSGFDPVPDDLRACMWPEALPGFFPAAEGAQAEGIVIGLHGYRATSEEIAPVMRACAAAGLDAVSLLFAGHGFSESAIQRAAVRQMYPRALRAAATREILRCRARGYRRVYLYGHSLGGAIALCAAAEQAVEGLALTAPAVALKPHARLVRLLPGFLDLTFQRASSAGDVPRRYRFDTTWAVRKLLRTGEHARALMPEVKAPTLVLLAGLDSVVASDVGDLIERGVAGDVQRREFPESGHSMTLDRDADAVAEAVARFLAGLS